MPEAPLGIRSLQASVQVVGSLPSQWFVVGLSRGQGERMAAIMISPNYCRENTQNNTQDVRICSYYNEIGHGFAC